MLVEIKFRSLKIERTFRGSFSTVSPMFRTKYSLELLTRSLKFTFFAHLLSQSYFSLVGNVWMKKKESPPFLRVSWHRFEILRIAQDRSAYKKKKECLQPIVYLLPDSC